MNTEYFLGANSADGFYSLYDEYCHEKGGYFHLIKGGPGGGKSGFMRRLAEAAEVMGYDTERILCSGDPSSLDAIYIIQLNIGYVDATSPHAIEPFVFGVNSDYVNLGEFCSVCDDFRIEHFTNQYKKMYSIAYSYLKAADCVKSSEISGIINDYVICKAVLRAQSAIRHEFGIRKNCRPSVSKRFIRCLSCDGEIVLSETVKKLCKHIFLLDDRFGIEQFYLMEIMGSAAAERLIICPSPLNPKRIDAVLIPEKSLGFVSSSLLPDFDAYRHIRLDSLVSADAVRSHKAEIRSREKLYHSLADTATGYLSRAKEYHDMLESAYRPYINFPALTEFTEREIESIKFGR